MTTTTTETVDEAKERIMEAAHDKGTDCPCCGQFVKVYRRRINSSMARGLIAAYKEFGTEFGYLQDVRRKNGETDNREESKLRYWGLMEEDDKKRPDGGRAGYWRVTELGERFVKNQDTVQEYALIYNGQCLGLEGKFTSIKTALGKNFNYSDLMRGI